MGFLRRIAMPIDGAIHVCMYNTYVRACMRTLIDEIIRIDALLRDIVKAAVKRLYIFLYIYI